MHPPTTKNEQAHRVDSTAVDGHYISWKQVSKGSETHSSA